MKIPPPNQTTRITAHLSRESAQALARYMQERQLSLSSALNAILTKLYEEVKK